MTTIQKSATVPFSSQQMFDLVNDVEQYPQFLPWCPKVNIMSRSDLEVEATVHFTKGIMGHSFTTINRLLPHEKIEMRLKEGPFRYLEGIWEFRTLSFQECFVSLNLSFEFSSKLLSLAAEPIFSQIASTLVQSFTQRAEKVYACA